MAYVVMTIKPPGYVVKYTDWNVMVENFKQTFVGQATTAGDTTYATGANAVTRQAIGSAGTIRHVTGGLPAWGDPEDGSVLDGDKVDIDLTPTYYSPDSSPSEADDVDDLAAHLKGIDNVFGNSDPPKAWCYIVSGGALGSPDFNVDSVTDNGVGDQTINWDTDFSSAVYAVVTAWGPSLTTNHCGVIRVYSHAVGSVRINTTSGLSFVTLTDFQYSVSAWGEQ